MDIEPHTSANLAPVNPEVDWKQIILTQVHDTRYLKVLSGHQYLVAVHPKTGAGIYVVDGNFGRDEFKAAMQEAQAAGLSSQRMTVYGRTATYAGTKILFTKFDELGLAIRTSPSPSEKVLL